MLGYTHTSFLGETGTLYGYIRLIGDTCVSAPHCTRFWCTYKIGTKNASHIYTGTGTPYPFTRLPVKTGKGTGKETKKIIMVKRLMVFLVW